MGPSQTYNKKKRSSQKILRINGQEDRKKARRACIRMTKRDESLNSALSWPRDKVR